MEKDQHARLSVLAALCSVTLGILIVIIVSILLATLRGPVTADGSDFSAIYTWQQRIQQYTALRELGSTFILAAIPLALLALVLKPQADPSPPGPLPMPTPPSATSEPATARLRRKSP